jgi:hypothetical protein
MAKKVTQTKASILAEMNAKINKLYAQAMKIAPGTARQKKIVEQIDALSKLREKLKNSK